MTVLERVTPVEYATKTTLSDFLVKLSWGTALSAAAAAGTPFGKVAVAEVADQPVTSTVADLKTAVAVKSEFDGNAVPVKVITFPDTVAAVTSGDEARSCVN